MNNTCQLVVFSNKAYNAIIRESFDKDPVETGGILLGHVLDNGVWIVMEVLPPGINSIFQYAYFEYDEAFVNYLAQSVANLYKRSLDLLGLWHRHPGNMDVFSHTDDGTNLTFARQNPAGVISGLVNIDPKFRLTMYHLDSPIQRITDRPNYTVVEVEVGDDIIPPEYFELRYYDGENSNLHPTVASRGRDRIVNRSFNENQEDHTEESNTTSGSLDMRNYYENNLPPFSEDNNPIAKLVDDFFSGWRFSKKKLIFALIAVIALITFVYSIRSCSKAVEGISSWVDEKTSKDTLGDSNGVAQSLSIDEIQLKKKGEEISFTLIYRGKEVTWKSYNPKVAKIDKGIVTAISSGSSVIEGFIDENSIGKCIVSFDIESEEKQIELSPNVIDESVSGQSEKTVTAMIDTTRTYMHGKEANLKIGQVYTLPIVKMGNSTPTISFVSTNSNVATVDNKGSITAKNMGETKILVLCNNKETDRFTLKVTEK